jgi:hypothetical protein
LLLIGVTRPAHAQKTDTLRLRNGDRIVGEIKNLNRALLSYSTDNMQLVSVEWDAVASLVSRTSFEIELQSGFKHYGRLTTAPAGYLVVTGAVVADTLPLGLVVHILPMRRQFWSRVDGYVDLGFTYQQANHNLQLTFGSQAAYRGPKVSASIGGSYFLQSQDSVATTSRSSLTLSEKYFVGSRWYVGSGQAFERNEELQLESRFKFGVGAERFLVQNDAIEFTLGAGAVLLREQYTGEDDQSVTWEGQVNLAFDAFRYNQPKLDLSTSLAIYPGLTELGRVRIDFDGRVSYELVKDFFLTVSVFERYDSRPPSETAAKSDFGTTLSITWSF